MNEFQGKMIRGEWRDVELRKNKLWVIVSPLLWIRPNGQHIILTPYLITDYATIPKVFWPILPKRNEHYDIAAAFHDDCLRSRKIRKLSKQDCHDVFKEIMKHYKTPKWQYEAMYAAVTVAGVFTRSSGYGQIPWDLSQKETVRYEQIKREYLWCHPLMLKNKDVDIFC